MILRRLADAVRRQDWFTVFIETAIVVIGVFLGIQVANWNESLAEDRRERTYLERLDAEFDVVEARIRRAVLVGETRRQATKSVMQAWKIGPRAFSDADAKGPGELFIEILSNIVPANSPAAFRELVSSGDLSIIENEALRTALYEFDAYSEVTQSAYESTQNDMRNLRHLIHSAYLFDIDTLGDDFLVQQEGASRAPKSIDGMFIPEAFFGNSDFRQALNGAAVSIINMRVLAERQQELVEQINILIAEELEK